jgi:serine/threonine protein phosphatase PrpC
LRHISRSDDTLELPRPNFITRALGAQDTLRIDRMTVELLDGDIFLLCTDGLSNEVSELSIEQASLPGNCTLACDALLGREFERGPATNVTAVAVRAEDLSSADGPCCVCAVRLRSRVCRLPGRSQRVRVSNADPVRLGASTAPPSRLP